jgi:hypothetical protein
VNSCKQINGLLCCDAVHFGRYVPKFRSSSVPPSSWQIALYLKVEEKNLSLTVLVINQNTNNHIPEDNKLNIHYPENLKTHVISYTPRVDCIRKPLGLTSTVLCAYLWRRKEQVTPADTCTNCGSFSWLLDKLKLWNV